MTHPIHPTNPATSASAEVVLELRQATKRYSGVPNDVTLMPSPVTHISGFSGGLEKPFASGSQVVLMEVWKAAEAVALIDRYGITSTVAATPFLQELCDAAEAAGSSLPTFRRFACGGAAVPLAAPPGGGARGGK